MQLLLELSLELLARKVGILVEDTEHILGPENEKMVIIKLFSSLTSVLL